MMMIRIMACLNWTSHVSFPLLPLRSLPHKRMKIYGRTRAQKGKDLVIGLKNGCETED